MKKIALILGFLLVSSGVFAQDRNDLRGPAYKNYKPWEHKKTPIVIYSDSDKKSLTGPAYKNYKRSKDTSKTNRVIISISGNERQKLRGPAYKNYKPWRKKAK